MFRLFAGALAAVVLALAAPAAARPRVAIVALNEGTEATDLFVPYAILAESGAVDVRIVAPAKRPVRLTPGVAWVQPQATMADLAKAWPQGPDVVIVPMMKRDKDPTVLDWLRRQAKDGARIMSVCNGARVLAATGLLDDREATVHWFSRLPMKLAYPDVKWREDRRWVTDGPFTSTTGISASAPATLNLLRELAGEAVMRDTARRMGLAAPDPRHRGDAFGLSLEAMGMVIGNAAAVWGHQDVAVPIRAGFDEIAFATVLDGWSRTFRSKAWATGAPAVTSRRGLTVYRAATPPEAFDRAAALPERAPMVTTFRAIEQAYGPATGRFVAMQFEHPWALRGGSGG